jgi:hypothetical protein
MDLLCWCRAVAPLRESESAVAVKQTPPSTSSAADDGHR